MLRRMIRVMLLPIVGAIALLLLAGPASAAPRVPNGFPFGPISFDADVLCPSFPVELKGVSPAEDGSQIVRTTLRDGTVILTGPLVLTITNLDNGSSATFNVSGPTFSSQSGTQLTLRGIAIILLFSGVGDLGPGILATSGQGTIDGGIFNDETFTGHTSDVCQQLS
jgi:hypothetical protein